MNRLSDERRAQILTALVEGNSIRSTCRMTGAAKATVLRLLEQVVNRMDRLEERVDFAERMLETSSRERQSLLSAMKEAGVRQERPTKEGRR